MPVGTARAALKNFREELINLVILGRGHPIPGAGLRLLFDPLCSVKRIPGDPSRTVFSKAACPRAHPFMHWRADRIGWFLTNLSLTSAPPVDSTSAVAMISPLRRCFPFVKRRSVLQRVRPSRFPCQRTSFAQLPCFSFNPSQGAQDPQTHRNRNQSG